MTPVFQTVDHERGNCLQAAVASVLDLPLNDVPDWSSDDGGWFQNLVSWASDAGLGVVMFRTGRDNAPQAHDVWVVAVGRTYRGDGGEDHAIVAKAYVEDGELIFDFIHDPHPSQAMLDTVDYAFLFTKQ